MKKLVTWFAIMALGLTLNALRAQANEIDICDGVTITNDGCVLDEHPASCMESLNIQAINACISNGSMDNRPTVSDAQ